MKKRTQSKWILAGMIILLGLAMILSACSSPVGGGGGGDPPPPAYIITGSGTAATATRGGAAIGTPEQSIQAVIDDIRDHAAGAAVTIQFGEGGANVLNISTESVSFSGAWGHITLTGSITSTNAVATAGTIVVEDTVTLTSTATIANTAGSGDSRAINHRGTGTLTINGGTVETDAVNTSTRTILLDSGTLNINGGTVHSQWGTAIYIAGNGTVSVSGGTVSAAGNNAATIAIEIYGNGHVTISGSALVTAMAMNNATIILTGTEAKLLVTGGTVRRYAPNNTNGNAIRNNGSTLDDAVTITGGTVGNMDQNSVHGGIINEVIGSAIRNDAAGRINISGSALITSADSQATGGTIRLADAEARLAMSGGTVRNTRDTSPNWAITPTNLRGDRVIITGGTITPAYP